MSDPAVKAGSNPTSLGNAPQATNQPGTKLLDRLRLALESRRYRPDTVGRFVEWNRQYILFHKLRHPQTMGREQIEVFLDHLAQTGYGAELQAQARQALAFLYREVLGLILPWPEVARARVHDVVQIQGEHNQNGGIATQSRAPKLLDRARSVLRARRYSIRTEDCYVDWMRRYILFHHKRHPLEMGGLEVEEFLTHLAVDGHVSISTQNQALHALLFLYQQVLDVPGMTRTWRGGSHMCRCPMRWSGSTRMRCGNWAGQSMQRIPAARATPFNSGRRLPLSTVGEPGPATPCR